MSWAARAPCTRPPWAQVRPPTDPSEPHLSGPPLTLHGSKRTFCFSDPQDTGVVPRSHHERRSTQNDHTAGSGWWVSGNFTKQLKLCIKSLFCKICLFFSLRLFLVRDSQSNPKAFVLTLCHHQKIKHFQILPVSSPLLFHCFYSPLLLEMCSTSSFKTS